jgi:hypothetical protein
VNFPLRIRTSNYVPTIHAPTIILSQNRWWTQLVIKLVCVPTKFPMPTLLPLGFPQHVFQIPNLFMNMFPITPHFVAYVLPHIILLEPICYTHIYIGIYYAFMFWVNTFVLGGLPSLTFDFPKFHKKLWCANQKISFQPKTNYNLGERGMIIIKKYFHYH